MLRNLGALTSWKPVGLLRPVMGQLTLSFNTGVEYTWDHKFNRIYCSISLINTVELDLSGLIGTASQSGYVENPDNWIFL
jgi:hypothetical protein